MGTVIPIEMSPWNVIWCFPHHSHMLSSKSLYQCNWLQKVYVCVSVSLLVSVNSGETDQDQAREELSGAHPKWPKDVSSSKKTYSPSSTGVQSPCCPEHSQHLFPFGRKSDIYAERFWSRWEGMDQECRSGSESRHPDGRQMLENISEQHVHFGWSSL